MERPTLAQVERGGMEGEAGVLRMGLSSAPSGGPDRGAGKGWGEQHEGEEYDPPQHAGLQARRQMSPRPHRSAIDRQDGDPSSSDPRDFPTSRPWR